MKSSASRDLAIRQELSTILDEFGEQEREVLIIVARRLLAGQRTIGRLDVHTDKRDWGQERREEIIDTLLYSAIKEFAAYEFNARDSVMATFELHQAEKASREKPDERRMCKNCAWFAEGTHPCKTCSAADLSNWQPR